MFAPKTVIEGLRGVGRVELELEEGQRAYVLLGRNAVGKTKTLEALFQAALYAYLAKLRWRVGGFPAGIHVFSSMHGDRWQIEAPGRDQYPDMFIDTATSERGTPAVFAGSQNRGFVDASKARAQKLGTAKQRMEQYVRDQISGMQSRFTSLNMDSGVEPWFVARAQSANRYQQSDDSREIEIEAVLDLMHRIDERVDPEFLKISGDEKVSIRVAGEVRQLDQLSSGFSSVLKLVQFIVAGYAAFTNERSIRDVRGTVFVDEIESHLHLSWQARIVRLLVELFPNTTFFLTTHSSLVTAQCRRGEAYVLERDEDAVVRSRLVESPGNAAFVDMLDDVFGVDVNALKRERMDPERQREAKAALLDLLESGDDDS